ncbi:unannotated protein [freshwater metagenome]|uniref:Unannotated protein n=1 Tax=freshwater metagenome TaxID=449393 RepID=A0A6J6QP97_9ZZZZ
MSCNLKASEPDKDFAPLFLVAPAAESKIKVPDFNVCKNALSSPTAISRMRALSVCNSGYCGDIAAIAVVINS